MNKYNVIVLLSLIMLGIGILRSKEDEQPVQVVSIDDNKWLNYPKAEYMIALEETLLPQTACKALQEHQRNQARGVNDSVISPSVLWKLKNDELHAQCSIETIEQTIARLQEQLKKDHEQLLKAKTEQYVYAQS
jgi:hypothetical protein